MAAGGTNSKRVRKPREERKAEILIAATGILVNEGHAELSLRRVAKEVSIRLSTVQHYFESREVLLNALIDDRVELYRESFAMVRAQAEGSVEEQARAVIEFLLYDSLDPETCGFFTQFWALGFQASDARQQLFELYHHHRKELADIVASVRPDLSPSECLKRAAMISSMIEGSMVHIGRGLPIEPDLEDLRERMADHLIGLINS